MLKIAVITQTRVRRQVRPYLQNDKCSQRLAAQLAAKSSPQPATQRVLHYRNKDIPESGRQVPSNSREWELRPAERPDHISAIHLQQRSTAAEHGYKTNCMTGSSTRCGVSQAQRQHFRACLCEPCNMCIDCLRMPRRERHLVELERFCPALLHVSTRSVRHGQFVRRIGAPRRMRLPGCK